MNYVRQTRTAVVLGTMLLACRADAGVGVLKADTYVSSGNASTNYGSSTLMNIGAGNAGLVQFDLAPSVSRLVSGLATSNGTPSIGRATLTVFINKAATAGTLSAAPVLGAWTESAVTNATLPSVGSAVATVPVTAGGQFVSLDITPLVQGWLTNNNDPTSPNYVGGGNFGVYLNSPDGGVFIVDTKEGTTTSHQAELNIDLDNGFKGVLTKSMTLNSPGFTSLFSVHLTSPNVAGGRVWYVVRATDGAGQIATEEGVIQWLATQNTITCTVQTTDKLHLGAVNSGCTPGFFNPLSQPGVSIFDNVSFSTPAAIAVHDVSFRIDNLSGATLRLEP